jgi:hypothetical protein
MRGAAPQTVEERLRQASPRRGASVLRREVAVDPEAIRGLALAAPEKLQAREIRSVRASPPHAPAWAAMPRQPASPGADRRDCRWISSGRTRPENAPARKLRGALAASRDAKDLLQLGASVAGAKCGSRREIQLRPGLIDFLRQDPLSSAPLSETLERLESLGKRLEIEAAALVTR